MSQNERSANGGGGNGQKRWRKRRRRRGSRGGGGGGGGGGGVGGGVPSPGADFMPEIDGDTEAVSGCLELQKDKTGWLRQKRHMYLPDDDGYDDVFVPAPLVRQYRMIEGSFVIGQGGIPMKGHKRMTLAEVDTIDGLGPEESKNRRLFKELTVVDPEPMMVLAQGIDDDISLRIVDLLCPIGRGQRGLIVAPPRSGKTVLLQKICHALSANYPDLHMMVLLIDERPEEATAWRRAVEGDNREVLVSTLDEGPKHHIMVSEMAMKRAQRLVETGQDVVILLDSITRLTRAYNSALGRGGGATMSGGIGSKVLEMPKKFFGSARNCEEGGSLTILATTLVDTGSRMDQVIFEEFKGTGNMELVLNRQLAERRIFPAIDIELS
ncbi:MAG: transcription termination factor Rho, partial [Planctomycetes bacterium]|nr:transcription termination factor Rho [Planctomycetota bacterium]